MKGTDLAVAQRVEHVLQLDAGGGYRTDVAATPVRDSFPDLSDPAGPGQGLDRFDGCPPDQPGALFGDRAAVHVGVGLMMLRGHPSPTGQFRRRGEPGECDHLSWPRLGRGSSRILAPPGW